METENKADDPRDPGTPAPEVDSVADSVLEELRSAGAKAAEYLDLAKRTQADFVNYQARVRRDREEYVRYAAEGLLRELLPVVDDLQRLTSSAAGVPALLEAVKITERELLRVLSKAGVRPIETVGKKFDPAFHEAAEMVEAHAGKAPGEIIEEVRKGYTLHDRVLRPANVKVARVV
ncbi:MAG TPA: nucleotide exchange factor GrpE [Planctomycetota bacterium]|nr:nucleotide exchange factor GrpE [Planctomycetota bacterium]